MKSCTASKFGGYEFNPLLRTFNSGEHTVNDHSLPSMIVTLQYSTSQLLTSRSTILFLIFDHPISSGVRIIASGRGLGISVWANLITWFFILQCAPSVSTVFGIGFSSRFLLTFKQTFASSFWLPSISHNESYFCFMRNFAYSRSDAFDRLCCTNLLGDVFPLTPDGFSLRPRYAVCQEL